jgi:hypothetical protein
VLTVDVLVGALAVRDPGQGNEEAMPDGEFDGTAHSACTQSSRDEI